MLQNRGLARLYFDPKTRRFVGAELAALERGFPEAQLQLCEKVVNGKETFNPMPFDAVVVEDQDRRRPVHVQALAEAGIETVGIAHVHATREEFRSDEPHHPLVRVHLGFQPSTARSHRSRGEVDERPFSVLLRLVECLLRVPPPGDSALSHCSALPVPTRTMHRLRHATWSLFAS